ADSAVVRLRSGGPQDTSRFPQGPSPDQAARPPDDDLDLSYSSLLSAEPQAEARSDRRQLVPGRRRHGNAVPQPLLSALPLPAARRALAAPGPRPPPPARRRARASRSRPRRDPPRPGCGTHPPRQTRPGRSRSRTRRPAAAPTSLEAAYSPQVSDRRLRSWRG